METFLQKKEDIKRGIKIMEFQLNLHLEIIGKINLRDKDQDYKKVGVLGIGDCFGEYALMSKKGLRAARITVLENEQYVNLGVLNR